MSGKMPTTNIVKRIELRARGSEETIGRQSEALGKRASKTQGTTVYRHVLLP